MTEFATLWDEAGASFDQEQVMHRMASARSEADSFAPFVLAAASPAEFDQRVLLAGDRLQATAAAHGVTPDALLGQIRGEHTLLLEAQASKTAGGGKMTCPFCSGAGSVPAQGHEDADDVDNGYVKCPACQGTGSGHSTDLHDDSHHSAAKAPQQPVQPQRGFNLYASLHTALEEGQNPLAWIQAQDPGNPAPEKPSEHLDHGDYSNSYSEVSSAAGVVGADKAAQASKRDPRHPFGQPKTAVVETRVLHLIRDRDPDGGSKEPTADDYAAHKNWAVNKFGQDAWDAYKGSNWDEHHEASKTAGRRHPFA